MSKAREFVDFWIENSVHAKEQFKMLGASQDVSELTQTAEAGRSLSLFAGLAEAGKEDADQQRNDANHHQKFNQSEAVNATGLLASPPGCTDVHRPPPST